MALPTIGVLVLGWMLLIVRSVLAQHLPWGAPLPETGLPLVLYLALKREQVTGGLAAFTLGYLTDLFAVGPIGLFSLTFLALHIFVSRASEHLIVESGLVQSGLTFFAGLLGALLQYGALSMTSAGAAGGGFTWGAVLWPILVTALFAPPLFAICAGIDRVTGLQPARGR